MAANEKIFGGAISKARKDRRSPSSDRMVQQFADALRIDRDWLYYLAGRFPEDVRDKKLSEKQMAEAMVAFRGGPRKGKGRTRPHGPVLETRQRENIIAGFLKERHGAAKYPVSTDDLTVLVERDTESLDQFADLSGYGRNVEGLTHFQPGRKPREDLGFPGRDENRQNR